MSFFSEIKEGVKLVAKAASELAEKDLSDSDEIAQDEKEEKFSGSLDSLDDFIRHEEHRLKCKSDILNQRSIENDMNMRRSHARLLARLTIGWILFLFVIILCQTIQPFGKKLEGDQFKLVIITLSGLIFGFYTIVIHYLFSRRKA